MHYNLEPYMRDIDVVQTLALAEAADKHIDFIRLVDHLGKPTLAALAQGRPVCSMLSQPKPLNGAEWLQRDARTLEIAAAALVCQPCPGADDAAIDEARSLDDDGELFAPGFAGIANDTARTEGARSWID